MASRNSDKAADIDAQESANGKAANSGNGNSKSANSKTANGRSTGGRNANGKGGGRSGPARRKKPPAASTVVEEMDEETHGRYEEAKHGELHIKELQKMTVAELHDAARTDGLTGYAGLKKQDLIFYILRNRVQSTGLMFGEGVLEVLPDGLSLIHI